MYNECRRYLCYALSVEDEDGPSGYYDSESVTSGPPLEAVVTIPIHPGTGAKGRDKPSRYTLYTYTVIEVEN